MQIKLPRELVNQLLHEAQHAINDNLCGLITTNSFQKWHCHRLKNLDVMSDQMSTIDIHEQFAKLYEAKVHDTKLFALYYLQRNKPFECVVFKNAPPSLLHLAISLETKGVLEIIAFRCIDNTIQTFELEIDDNHFSKCSKK